MGSQKLEGFKISEISELARLEFERKKNSTRNHIGKPNKKNEHEPKIDFEKNFTRTIKCK